MVKNYFHEAVWCEKKFQINFCDSKEKKSHATYYDMKSVENSEEIIREDGIYSFR